MLRGSTVAIWVVFIGLSVWGACKVAYRASIPDPVRAFAENRQAFEEVAAGARDGTWPMRVDGQGLVIPQSLLELGVCRIRDWENGQLRFFFAPSDPWQTDQLVYSPFGRHGLPSPESPTLTDAAYLSANWLYLRSNN